MVRFLALIFLALPASAKFTVSAPASSSSVLVVSGASSSGITYDSDKIEFSSGSAKLKNQYSSDVVFAAKFSSSINGDYSRDGGSLTGTATGTVTITGGKLDLTGAPGVYKELSFDSYKNLPSGNVMAFRARITPNWSGDPSTRQWFLASSRTSGSDVNGYIITQITSGNLYQQSRSTVNVQIIDQNVDGTSYFTAGQTYEIECNFNGTSGVHNCYLDDARVLNGTATGIIDQMFSAYFQIGGSTGDTSTDHANFKMHDLVIYDTVQNTGATRTTGYTVPSTKYLTTDPTLKNTTQVSVGSFVSFDAGSSASGSDAVKYQIEVGGQAKYWNGSAWANSNGSYAQSNTASEINTNISSLTAGSTRVVAVLHSADGSTTPALTYAQLVYQ